MVWGNQNQTTVTVNIWSGIVVLSGWTAHLFCFAHLAPKLKNNLEGLFCSSDSPAGTVPMAKHFQGGAQSWQDRSLAFTGNLSFSLSSHLHSVMTKGKLLWRSIPVEWAMRQHFLQVPRTCTLLWDYSPLCAVPWSDWCTGDRLKLETEGDVLSHSDHCIPDG